MEENGTITVYWLCAWMEVIWNKYNTYEIKNKIETYPKKLKDNELLIKEP